MTVKYGTQTPYSIYAFLNADVTNLVALSLMDLGYTDEQVIAADVVYISIEGDDVRWRADGDDPTTGEGIPEASDTKFDLWGFSNLRNFRIIAQSGTATLNMFLARQGGAP